MMPAVSEKQKKFMDAAANNPAFAKQANIPIRVAKEFSEKSKGMKFGKGSNAARPDLQKVNKPKTLHGKMSLMKEGGDTMTTKKMANGGMPMKDGKPAFIGDGKGEMKKGGMAKMAKSGMPPALAKHAAMKASKAHAGLKSGGSASSRADGIATKGKTRGKMC